MYLSSVETNFFIKKFFVFIKVFFNFLSLKKILILYLFSAETSTAYGGGAPNLSDRFVGGFLWLDKLGYSASAGLQIVIRQSFYGGNYAMIGQDLNPNPDWWVSVIYKELVSEKVLNFKAIDLDETTRIYAHCTAKKSLINRAPAVTLFGINLHPTKNINLALYDKKFDKKKTMFVYSLHADSLQSR